MKNILKKVGAFLCASVIIALCYPKIGDSISLAETLEMDNSNNVKIIDIPNTVGNTETKFGTSNRNATPKQFTATAYALRGITRNGSRVRRGVVAADPRILPLGTKIHINAGAWSGTYLVADTGGVIKGHIIDVWVPSNNEARKFGRRKVMLTILDR